MLHLLTLWPLEVTFHVRASLKIGEAMRAQTRDPVPAPTHYVIVEGSPASSSVSSSVK
jgi:hypothetical protein